jgi:hypothetical protein
MSTKTVDEWLETISGWDNSNDGLSKLQACALYTFAVEPPIAVCSMCNRLGVCIDSVSKGEEFLHDYSDREPWNTECYKTSAGVLYRLDAAGVPLTFELIEALNIEEGVRGNNTKSKLCTCPKEVWMFQGCKCGGV